MYMISARLVLIHPMMVGYMLYHVFRCALHGSCEAGVCSCDEGILYSCVQVCSTWYM